MNYKKLYKQFINSRKSRTALSGYSESHHIVPRCLSGSDDDKNLVKLTAREHYFAHAVLSRIYNNNQMANAWYMTTRKYKHQRYISEYKIKKASDSRIGKTFSSEHRAKISAAKTGKKRGPASPETRAKLSAAQTGKKLSPETRAKLSAATKGIKRGPASPETRAAMSAAKMGNTYALKKKLVTSPEN